uniref:Ion_trans domain-containing protein n=1 Tax=Macrostomum lignano TaxID=282301 RepID=A0A1I8IVR3_9PLAT
SRDASRVQKDGVHVLVRDDRLSSRGGHFEWAQKAGHEDTDLLHVLLLALYQPEHDAISLAHVLSVLRFDRIHMAAYTSEEAYARRPGQAFVDVDMSTMATRTAVLHNDWGPVLLATKIPWEGGPYKASDHPAVTAFKQIPGHCGRRRIVPPGLAGQVQQLGIVDSNRFLHSPIFLFFFDVALLASETSSCFWPDMRAKRAARDFSIGCDWLRLLLLCLRHADAIKMASVKKFLVATLFEYETQKVIAISSYKIGLIYRSIQLLIVTYVVGWVMLREKGYQSFDHVVSGVTTKLK